MAKEVVVTREGYDKLVHDLDELRTVKRKEVADKIKVARGYGDLSENAEYDAAKEEQAVVEARIADLEATLKLSLIHISNRRSWTTRSTSSACVTTPTPGRLTAGCPRWILKPAFPAWWKPNVKCWPHFNS